jgi:serine O-acetyltransferase
VSHLLPASFNREHVNLSAAFGQISHLQYELGLMVNRRWWRIYTCLFSHSFCTIASYRLDRLLFLAFGPAWQITRQVLSPLSFLLRPWLGSCEIHYKADIGRGFRILHPNLGVVISSYAEIGDHLTLTGGNCIGRRRGGPETESICIGNHVLLGANAVVLGPIHIGDRVSVAAGSVVLQDVRNDAVVGGVPAKLISAVTRHRGPESSDDAMASCSPEGGKSASLN